MAGYIIPLASKRLVDFGTLAVGATQDVVLLDRIDLLHWREVTLLTRVHQNLIASGAGSITFGAVAESWTPEEPDMIFLGGEFMQGAVNSSVVAPALLSNALTMRGTILVGDCMSAMGRVIARGSRAAAGTLAVQASLEFSVKDA